jgi:hypothetical protein
MRLRPLIEGPLVAMLFTSGGRRCALLVYRRLAATSALDDLDGGSQRRWARVLYLVAIVLPTWIRAPWVGASLSASRSKGVLRRAWRFVGGG